MASDGPRAVQIPVALRADTMLAVGGTFVTRPSRWRGGLDVSFGDGLAGAATDGAP